MRLHSLSVALAGALFLAGCGSGGGGGGDNGSSDTVSVDLSGQAAKGLVARGRVSVHAVGADGAMSDSALGSVDTDASGGYSLSVNGTRGRPLIVIVRGQANTSHRDEISDADQALPVVFKMRASIVPKGNVSTRVTISPFSEMAVAAAEKADGKLSSDNLDRGNSVVRQLLGFDPTKVEVKTSVADATVDEQKMAVMLTAVSQLANSGQAGCSSGSGGEKATCVVDALANAATTTSLELKAPDGSNLGQQVAAAVETALEQPRFAGSVSEAVLTTILSNLRCTGDDCKVAPPPASTGDAVADGIAAARALVTELKSDLTALFVSGTTSGIGDAKTQATRFGDAMEDVQVPVELLVRDTSLLVLGIDLWNDYKAGRTTNPRRGRLQGEYASAGPEPSSGAPSGIGCTLFQDSATTTAATSPTNAFFIGCAARFFVDFNTSPPTEFIHGFTLTPTSTSGQFTYSARARSRQVNPSTGAQTNAVNLQSSSRNGTLTFTVDGGGHMASFTATGSLPGAFEMDGSTLVSDHNNWSVNGSRSGPATGTSTISLTASVAVKDASDVTTGTLTVNSGTLGQVPDGSGGTLLSGTSLDLSWATPSAELRGSFSLGGFTTSADEEERIPTSLTLAGELTNIEGGTRTTFVSGTMTLTVDGFGAFNAGQPTTSTNAFTLDGSFTGTVTAPSRPSLRFTFGASGPNSADEPSAVSLQYRSFVSGTPRMAITVSATRNSAGVPVVTLSEASAGLSITATRGAASADLMLGGTTKIGELDLETSVLTFTDGTFISMDLTP
jgi:hypothetical protein